MALASELFVHTVGVGEEWHEFLNAFLAGGVYILDEKIVVGCGQASPVKGRDSNDENNAGWRSRNCSAIKS